jgi:3-oxoacyl-[acyl-carrier protein] reductase
MTGYAALITGSSRGIGKAIAEALAREGFAIALNAEAPSAELDAAVADISALGVKCIGLVADIGDIGGHEALLDAAEEALGPLTTLVNNAGVSVMKRGDLLDVHPDSYDRCMRINARGPFFLTQSWARRVLARQRPAGLHHSVVTVSSSNAQAVSIARGEYCMSKISAGMMAKLFAVRLGGDDIGSYEIQPGVIETDMTRPVHDDYVQRIRNGLTVAQRMGTPADIASIAKAMATGQMAFCTGQSVQADGGLLIPRF